MESTNARMRQEDGKERVRLPDWFKEKIGFQFLDSMGNLYVVGGSGQMRQYSGMGELALPEFKLERRLYRCHIIKKGLAAICFHKKGDVAEWYFINLLEHDKKFWDGCKPFTEARIKTPVVIHHEPDDEEPIPQAPPDLEN